MNDNERGYCLKLRESSRLTLREAEKYYKEALEEIEKLRPLSSRRKVGNVVDVIHIQDLTRDGANSKKPHRSNVAVDESIVVEIHEPPTEKKREISEFVEMGKDKPRRILLVSDKVYHNLSENLKEERLINNSCHCSQKTKVKPALHHCRLFNNYCIPKIELKFPTERIKHRPRERHRVFSILNSRNIPCDESSDEDGEDNESTSSDDVRLKLDSLSMESQDVESKSVQTSPVHTPICHTSVNELRRLKEFRNKNLFECHSSTSLLERNQHGQKDAAHKCEHVYFLNDRLFPTPLNKDHKDESRCRICALPPRKPTKPEKKIVPEAVWNNVNPLAFSDSEEDVGILNSNVLIEPNNIPAQITLKFPMRNIIHEKKPSRAKISRNTNNVVKVNQKFFQTKDPPLDSLALKYQRGYRELRLCK